MQGWRFKRVQILQGGGGGGGMEEGGRGFTAPSRVQDRKHRCRIRRV